MTKHLSTYKVQRGTTYYTVPRDTLYKTNGFPMAKTEAMLPLVEPISKEESPYTDALDRRDPVGIDEAAEMPGRSENTEMPGKNEDIKMPDVRQIPPESEHTTSSRSRSGIQSI